jgi:bifunctional non-homologous end joining protein LigD
MLATPWPGPFDDDAWIFELKWDGVRCLLSTGDGAVSLTSRAGNDMTRRYPEIAGLDLPRDLVLDGEIVALDESGRPSFERLQGRMNIDRRLTGGSPIPVTLVVFDLLHDGSPLLDLPLEERGARIERLGLPEPIVVGDRFVGQSSAIWEFVQKNDLEGIVAKRLGSRYSPGARSLDWRKIGYFKHVRAVVGGFTSGSGGRESTFGSLVLGLWDDGRLRWVGAVGSGFDDKSLHAIRKALDAMTRPGSPFGDRRQMPPGTTWVEPNLVAMVRFKQWTEAGKLRAPSFRGFTDDPPEEIIWEREGPSSSV